MGQYAQCWLGQFYVGSTKNDIDERLIGLVRAEDKRIVEGGDSPLPVALERWREHMQDDPEIVAVFYEAPLSIVRDRLELLGYTLPTCKAAFDAAAELERQEQAERIQNVEPSQSRDNDHWKEHLETRLQQLSVLNADNWMAQLSFIRESDLKPNFYGRYEGPHAADLVGYMLENQWYGFPGIDLFVALRLAIEVCDETESFVYDVTDLVPGYFDVDEDLIEYSIDLVGDNHRSLSKIVILTEGKSDVEILSLALPLLYPHLSGYFSFMDFEGQRVGGGAGNLVSWVKAFAGAGIENRTVALFDNDTAARSALRTLEKVSLPSHIQALTLPSIPFLEAYPTIGPSGPSTMDINGLAASLELYLGEDVLQNGASYFPIQWTGFDAGLNQYQGEVLEKRTIQERFLQKAKRAVSEPTSLSDPSWSALREVFQAIFAAFQEHDRGRILELAQQV